MSLAAAFPLLLRRAEKGFPVKEESLGEDEDLILDRLGRGNELARLATGEIVAEMGKSFLGTPYAANTLEGKGEEISSSTFVNLTVSRCVRQALPLHAPSNSASGR